MTPPTEVLVEFLRVLNETVIDFEEDVVPVLRGSLLLRHWFRDKARPAADIDLECFEQTGADILSEQALQRAENRYGRYEEFESLVDFGKAMCRYAANTTQNYRWIRTGKTTPEIEYVETEVPADGDSLWAYGTPGERYYAGWVWHGRGGATGRMQIDIAQPRSYRLNDIAIANVQLIAPGGTTFDYPAYTPEMLLAAKLSWLLRGLTRRTGGPGISAPTWKGEPKDLFDIHLLLTKEDLRADVFQNCLLAVGAEDQLDWNSLEALFDVWRADMKDEAFPNWTEFHARHHALIPCGPAELLLSVADRLEPLLGDFARREELPFLLEISADPVNEVPYLIYSDWLEERGDPRNDFLRLYSKFLFHLAEVPIHELNAFRTALQASLLTTSPPWLHRLFGTSARLQEFRQRIDGLFS